MKSYGMHTNSNTRQAKPQPKLLFGWCDPSIPCVYGTAVLIMKVCDADSVVKVVYE